MRKLFSFLVFALLLVAHPAVAQDTAATFPDIATLTPATLFNATVEPLYGLLVVASGYLTAFIPGLARWKPFYRVAAFALAFGLGAYLFGASTISKLGLTYFISTGLYEVFIKHIFASPKAQGS